MNEWVNRRWKKVRSTIEAIPLERRMVFKRGVSTSRTILELCVLLSMLEELSHCARKWLISVWFLLLLLSLCLYFCFFLSDLFPLFRRAKKFTFFIRSQLIRIEKSIFLIYFNFVMSFLLCHNFRPRFSFSSIYNIFYMALEVQDKRKLHEKLSVRWCVVHWNGLPPVYSVRIARDKIKSQKI